MNILLPEPYKELLRHTNGFSTHKGLVIYGTDDGCDFNNMSEANANQTHNKYYNILLIDKPKGGLKDLVKIKNGLNVEMPSVELLKVSKNLPFPIVRNIYYGKAVNYLEKSN